MSDQTTSAPTHTSDAIRADAAYKRRFGNFGPDAGYADYLQGWFDAVHDERRPGKVTYVPGDRVPVHILMWVLGGLTVALVTVAIQVASR